MKLIAAFEALKGLVVLLAGLAAQIVQHLHLDPVGACPGCCSRSPTA